MHLNRALLLLGLQALDALIAPADAAVHNAGREGQRRVGVVQRLVLLLFGHREDLARSSVDELAELRELLADVGAANLGVA